MWRPFVPVEAGWILVLLSAGLPSGKPPGTSGYQQPTLATQASPGDVSKTALLIQEQKRLPCLRERITASGVSRKPVYRFLHRFRACANRRVAYVSTGNTKTV